MANKKPSAVEILPDDIRDLVDGQLDRGVPVPQISKWLATRGHKVTSRQIYGYKAQMVPKAPTATPVGQDSASYGDYSDQDKFKRLLNIAMANVDYLNDFLKSSGDLSTARALREMIETASGLLKYQLQYNQPDPVTHVTFNIGSLEDTLGTPEYTDGNWAHFGSPDGNLPDD
ncbi:MAG TPA: hypothetical protein VE944_06810 [Nostoc sp.]|uniref:hypothetical protein n=1 Tax=Nostoc sp. TaxID=1180 RepID=UPI002D4D3139|nr:hypothetical protein [Nostoc sp.]HYX14067.1 hypothetical protein [Nostoc sp.]